MACRALCVGIDEVPGVLGSPGGCGNDACAWARLLVDHYDFPSGDVALLRNEDATRRALLASIDRLLAGTRPGDLLVLTHASLGTYVPDRDGDATYDEALCPWDYRANLVLDDEIRERFANVPARVRIAFVADSCHAGIAPERASEPGDRRARFLSPEAWGGASVPALAALRPRRMAPASTAIRLAACAPNEPAWDADFDGRRHGALTYHAIRAIAERGYDLSWAELHAELAARMTSAGFTQHPQLEARSSDRARRVFS